MVDLIIYAIPAFVLLLVVELLSFRYARDEELVGYESRDTRASLAMGGGNVVIKLDVDPLQLCCAFRLLGVKPGEGI